MTFWTSAANRLRGKIAKKKHDFYLAVMPASWAQTELKGSEYTPPDTLEPLGTTGGGYRARLKWNFASANADRFFSSRSEFNNTEILHIIVFQN